VFVIAMIFAHFRVPLAEQHRVLFWGIFGAVVLRAIMITGGVALMATFDWVAYFFGALLIYSAVRMLTIRHDNVHPEKSPFVRLARRYFPVTTEFHGSRFFVMENGVRTATPLLLALLLVEASDITFAIDSIPAILAITIDPFIVFTSNVFALLGLRSLYFVLAGLMEKFRYLKLSLVFLLAYIGVKMMLVHHYPIPNTVSLVVIGGILAVGVLVSLVVAGDPSSLRSPLADELERIALVTYRQARRAAILIVGSSMLLIGIAMVVLPGPAIIVITLALSLLAVEFAWARRGLRRVKAESADVRARLVDAVSRRRDGPDDPHT
jgi:tellurite resistance protein TerC